MAIVNPIKKGIDGKNMYYLEHSGNRGTYSQWTKAYIAPIVHDAIGKFASEVGGIEWKPVGYIDYGNHEISQEARYFKGHIFNLRAG